MRQPSNSVASRPPAIDLKLRLALRVAALAGLCFIAVAAYALFDSDRVAKAKASRIAEIVARDLSLQQSQAQWLSVSINATPDLQGIAALLEPGLCIAYRDNAGAFRQGVCTTCLRTSSTVGSGAAWLCVGKRLTAPAAMPMVAIRARLGGFGRRCVPIVEWLLCASVHQVTALWPSSRCRVVPRLRPVKHMRT